MEGGGETSRRKNKPQEPQLFMHLSHESVSPVSTLVWLARGLAGSLPTLLPPNGPRPKVLPACSLLRKGPGPLTWSHPLHLEAYHTLVKICSSFFFFFFLSKHEKNCSGTKI